MKIIAQPSFGSFLKQSIVPLVIEAGWQYTSCSLHKYLYQHISLFIYQRFIWFYPEYTKLPLKALILSETRMSLHTVCSRAQTMDPWQTWIYE